MEPTEITVRSATAEDVALILSFIRKLAEFDGSPESVEATPEKLRETLFADTPPAGVLIAERAGSPVGFASYFQTYSTWLARPGIWLDDLYVDECARGQGIGSALIQHLASLAKERGCGRLEWTVQHDNPRAIAFYEKQGARVSERARLCRMTRTAILQVVPEAPPAKDNPAR